jgi:protein involved in polysaccharide export with SLBB domain
VGGREVTVVGAVKKPGSYPFRAGMRLSDAIAAAGGLRADADRNKVEIRWAIGGRQVVTLDGTDESLSAGDEVVIPIMETKDRIYVRGAIAKPGLVPFSSDLTVSKAVAESSPIQGARLDGVKVIRKGADGKTQNLKVNLKKVAEGKEHDMALMPGDIVDVPYPSSSYSTESTMKLVSIGLLLLFFFRG